QGSRRRPPPGGRRPGSCGPCGLACARQSLLRLMALGHGTQTSLEPLGWRLRLPRAALAFAEPTLVRSGVAPRALWGEVPGEPAGPACRTAAGLIGSWPAWPAAPADLLVVGFRPHAGGAARRGSGGSAPLSLYP